MVLWGVCQLRLCQASHRCLCVCMCVSVCAGGGICDLNEISGKVWSIMLGPKDVSDESGW